MPRPGLTKDDVFTAIEVLVAQDQIPTAAAIRDELGKGSFSTIHKHLIFK